MSERYTCWTTSHGPHCQGALSSSRREQRFFVFLGILCSHEIFVFLSRISPVVATCIGWPEMASQRDLHYNVGPCSVMHHADSCRKYINKMRTSLHFTTWFAFAYPLNTVRYSTQV